MLPLITASADHVSGATLQPTSARAGLKADLLVAFALALCGFVVFLPGLRSGFVSDVWFFLDAAQTTPFSSLIAGFQPNPHSWYRPLTELTFWLEFKLFGFNSVSYHLFALGCHVLSSVILYFLAKRLTSSRMAAGVAAFTFLLSIHAHEVVWDTADLHNALGGVVLLGAVTAYAWNRKWLATILLIILLMVDETGLLVFPFFVTYEVLFGGRLHMQAPLPSTLGSSSRVPRLLSLLPAAIITMGYLVLRFATGVYNETVPCRTQDCLFQGMLHYTDRLLIRPEVLIAGDWVRHYKYGFLAILLALGLFLLLRPWGWIARFNTPEPSGEYGKTEQDGWKPIAFALAWLAISISYFVYALWGYVSDRFLYVPDMGLALLFGGLTSQVINHWSITPVFWRRTTMVVGGLTGLWLMTGVVMLWHRGEMWAAAGDEAHMIVERVHALAPNPDPGSYILLYDTPDSLSPAIPPGNTGPYVFRNGIESAVGLTYEQRNFTVMRGRPDTILPVGAQVVRISVAYGDVKLIDNSTPSK